MSHSEFCLGDGHGFMQHFSSLNLFFFFFAEPSLVDLVELSPVVTSCPYGRIRKNRAIKEGETCAVKFLTGSL